MPGHPIAAAITPGHSRSGLSAAEAFGAPVWSRLGKGWGDHTGCEHQ